MWIICAQAQGQTATLIATLQDTTSLDQERWQAATSLANATFADAAERQAAVDTLIAAASDRDVGVRVNAIAAIGRLREVTAEAILARAIADGNSLVRQTAARALGRIGTEKAVERLALSLGDPSGAVRVHVVRALGESGHPLAVGPLDELLRIPSARLPQGLKAEVIRSLQRLGGYAVESLIRAFDANDAELRRQCAQALGSIADPRAGRALIRRLNDSSADVAMAATRALGRLGEPAITPLIEALDTQDATVRHNAMTSLVGVGSPAVGPLASLYSASAARLAELDIERAQAVLDDDMPARAPAPAPLPVGVAAAPMTDAEIKRELTKVRDDLKTLNQQRARAEQLVYFRQAATVYERRIESATQLLAGGVAPAPPVQTALIVGVTPLAIAPTEASLAPHAPLRYGGGAVARSLEAIDEEIGRHRSRARSAILALGGVGTDEAVTILADVIQTGIVDDATVAADAIGRSRNATAVPTLTAVLADTTYPSSVRVNAARGLGRLGAEQARAALTQASTTDTSANVRDAAVEALKALGTPAGT